MRIGYPCINTGIGCRSGRTFRLKSYSEERLIATVENNLDCLARILEFNARNDLLFFRITSDVIPFASHPACRCNWQRHFAARFAEIGRSVRRHAMRISMHPDQFIVINSPSKEVVENSLRELAYHAEVLDLMGLDESAKIQIHVGGVYGDRVLSMVTFARRYATLTTDIRRRLVVENDERSYALADCLKLSAETGIPVLFDALHHQVHNRGESRAEALRLAAQTWKKADGPLMVDYSQAAPGEPRGRHATSIDVRKLRRFLSETTPLDFDIMLEIKDKEKSALRAVKAARHDLRFMATSSI
ncbi:MAG: UV DNA damage repair endonuclease UvsE [Dehalococcoidia bacterium]|nr:UV DNA damage repair endonuclease UvsE [Dehalococcoidia bacterium]